MVEQLRRTDAEGARGMRERRQANGETWGFDGKPITLVRRGGRKVIIAPDGGDAWAPAKRRPDETLIRALARAHRWKRLADPLEQGDDVGLDRHPSVCTSADGKPLQFHLQRRRGSEAAIIIPPRSRPSQARPQQHSATARRGDRKPWTREPAAQLERQSPELGRNHDVSL